LCLCTLTRKFEVVNWTKYINVIRLHKLILHVYCVVSYVIVLLFMMLPSVFWDCCSFSMCLQLPRFFAVHFCMSFVSASWCYLWYVYICCANMIFTTVLTVIFWGRKDGWDRSHQYSATLTDVLLFIDYCSMVCWQITDGYMCPLTQLSENFTVVKVDDC